jgi:transcriptional regulator with XRE-family HTH domain
MSNTFDQHAVAGRFLTVRSHLNLSQKAFAESLGISLGAEQNYERGNRQISASVIYSVYKVYDVDPQWLLDGEEGQPRFMKNRGGLNKNVLSRAVKDVLEAIEESGRDVPSEIISKCIGVLYASYLSDNDSKAAVEMINVLLEIA